MNCPLKSRVNKKRFTLLFLVFEYTNKKYLKINLNIMIKIKYNKEQIKELKSNSNVKNCTQKHIVFTKKFKIKVIELSKQYISPKEIFKQFWFPEYVIFSRIPSLSVDRWKRNINKKWIIEENKWRKNKEIIDFDKMSLKEQNEYLKTKVLFLEELNNLLKSDYP